MKFKYGITGLDCPSCAAKLAKMIERKEGVSTAKINFLTEKLTVEAELDEDTLFTLVSDTARAFDKSVKIEK